MIPKIIHYCWFGGKPLNAAAQKCIDSWKRFCPDYEIKEWNETNFDIQSNSYAKEAYEAKRWAFITDYVRLSVLYEYGGIYMDTDVELLKPVDAYLGHTAFSGFEDVGCIPTAILGSVAHGEWVGFLLSYYENRHFVREDGGVDLTTNVTTITRMTKERYSIRLDNTFQEVAGCFTLYPKEYFCPKDYETGEIALTEHTVCIHHFTGSWRTEEERLLGKKWTFLKRRFGDKLGEKLFWAYFYARRARKNYGPVRILLKLVKIAFLRTFGWIKGLFSSGRKRERGRGREK